MDKKSKNTLIVSIIALALVLIGVTYAYFSARITGLESASTISLTAGRMGITYAEGDETVTVNNIYPRAEEWLTKTITLTGYNTIDKPMKYDLGFNITTNTFKGGQLTLSLTGVGSNGIKIADIESKSIVGQNKFFKIGTGTFAQANGDTHVYTLKIYFKDNGKDQNINQDAVFSAKIHVREQGSQVAKTNQNHNGKHCYTNDYVANQTPANGTEYVNGQYTYKYNYHAVSNGWAISTSQNGWGVMLTDKTSTDPVTTELCGYVNEKPIASMSYMFNNSRATSIDLSSFDTSNVTDMSSMFDTALASSLDLSSFDTSNVTTMGTMFAYANASSLDLSSFDTSNVTSMGYMFFWNKAQSINLSSFDTSSLRWGGMDSMFYYSRATSLDLSGFDTSKLTTLKDTFGYSMATSINGLNGFDTSNMTQLSRLFEYSHVADLDLSSFDTSNVTTMDSMFDSSYVTSINGLDILDTSEVTDMHYMFKGIRVPTLDLSSFDTSKVLKMYGMFSGGASNLTTIYVSNSFVTSSLESDGTSAGSTDMFANCSALVGGAGTTYDANNINKAYAHIDGGSSNPGYFTAK